MNKDAPAFDFYPERWLVGTAAMTDAEQLSYLKLLCHQWTMDGLPEDPAVLKRLAGRGVTPAVLIKFPVTDEGKRRNKRLEAVRFDQRKRIAKSREKIEKMNSARKGKNPAKSPAQEPLKEPLQDGLEGPSCRLPHHSPLTTGVLLEKEHTPYPQEIEPFAVRLLEAVVSAYPRNGNELEAKRAVGLLNLTVPEMKAVLVKVQILAGKIAELPDGERRWCPSKHRFFEERRWNDDPSLEPWTSASAPPSSARECGYKF